MQRDSTPPLYLLDVGKAVYFCVEAHLRISEEQNNEHPGSQ